MYILWQKTTKIQKKKNTEDSGEREPTIKELEEQLRRKRLQEELAKKARKQTRDFDESMLAVCQTCHVPIYVGEPLYNQRGEQIIGLYAGAFGGAYGGGIVAGGYRARSERYKTTEKWIQCGHCYAEYHKEIEKWNKFYKERRKWELTSSILCLILVIALIYLFGKKYWKIITPEEKKSMWRNIGTLIGFLLIMLFFDFFRRFLLSLFALLGLLGKIFYWIVKGSSPIEPKRFRIRKNPYRKKLMWKLDNEGKPIKEGSTKEK